MKLLLHFLFYLTFLFGLVLFLLSCFLLFASVRDYRPPSKQVIPMEHNSSPDAITSHKLSFMIWNIGYGGLGQEMDFFYDGGVQVRPQKMLYQKYFDGITNFISQNNTIDFILLQEVDQKSKRSYFNNQAALISDAMKNYGAAFAKNYDVTFVPVPLQNPMGRVKSGLLTLSKYNPLITERIAYEGNFAWPKRLFMLDRCFLVQRFRVETGRELVVINTHNSAFDDGQLRKSQMEKLCRFALDEYAKGNYVVLGGDWNQNPPGFQAEKITSGDFAVSNDLGNIETNEMPSDWIWAYDPKTPSNRSVQKSYTKTKTPTTIIDFFLVSPNISIENIETQDLNFAYADHNPVLLSLDLRL